MQMFSMLIAALMGIGLVHAAPTNSFDQGVLVTPNKTYNIIDIQWYLEVNNTFNVTATGTIQDLFGNLTVANPQAAAAINQTASGSLNETSFTELQDRELQDRDGSSIPTTIICNKFAWASAQRIRDGINYLRGVPGKPSNGPGPGNCGRVSCSYNSAIYWCNDNLETKVLDSYGQIADGAWSLFLACDPNWIHAGFSGQQFYNDGWNVIVREDRC